MQPSKTKPKGPIAHMVHASSPEPVIDASKVRAYAACKSCRLKKVKCQPGPTSNPDGSQGVCQQCAQSGTECVYPPTRDRAAYSRQYVQNLEARVQALEGLTGRLNPLLEAYERSNGILPMGTLAGPSSTSKHLDMAKIEHNDGMEEEDGEGRARRETSSIPSEMDDGGQMTQDERGNYRWIGSSNTLSLLDSFSHNRSPLELTPPVNGTSDGNPYFGHVAGSGVVKALPGVDEVNYPDPRRAGEMVDAFFREVHPVLPLMEEKAFREGYKALMERRARGQPEIPGGFVSVVFAVFALGERVLIATQAWQREKERLTGNKSAQGEETVLPGEAEAGVIWYERAQILHYTTLKDVNIHQVQCLTLMAAFQASVNAMPISWLLAGQAIRVAQDLGLHRSNARMRLSFVEKQIRARCWWALYGLERLVGSQLGRPLGVDDLDIDVAYPAIIDDHALSNLPRNQVDTPDIGEEPYDSTMSGFLALTKICKIAGKVAQLLYRPSHGRSVSDPAWANNQQITINKLDKTLKEWLEKDVPSKYKASRSTGAVQLVSAVLSNAYFAVRLTLHRNFLPSNPDYARPRPPSNSPSLSILVEAARSVIFTQAQQRILLPPSHHLAAGCHNLWSSAVILLLCEVQAKDQIIIESVGSSVESCRQTLQTLEPAWPGSRKLKELLVDVEARTKEVAVNGMAETGKRKRKSIAADGRPSVKRQTSSNMLPPSTPVFAQTNNAQSWSYGNRAPPPNRAYETSDTRTIVEDEYNFTQPNSNTSSFPSTTQITPPAASNGTIGTIDTNQMFDIGGVTFDGLEMLQGFDFNADSTNFWNSFISPTAGGQYAMSGQTTPVSNSGPSPKSWQVPSNHLPGTVDTSMTNTTTSNLGMGMANQGVQNGINNNNNTFGAEFWSQVAPGGYDWLADPNVPFNI